MNRSAQREMYGKESWDKATRILLFLDRLGQSPIGSDRIYLHGGTALNSFILPPHRLSLDADINYLGPALSQADRATVERALCSVAESLGYHVEAGKEGHAGRTFKFVYQPDFSPRRTYLKVDLDYMNRVPLLDPKPMQTTFPDLECSFRIAAPVEAVASKIGALRSRVVPRDLYDAVQISRHRSRWSTGSEELDHAFVFFYLSLSASFPKPVDLLGRFASHVRDFEQILWPVLPLGDNPLPSQLADDAREFLHWATSPQTEAEREYLALAERGDYRPELLFREQPEIASRAASSPILLWKAENLRKAYEAGAYGRPDHGQWVETPAPGVSAHPQPASAADARHFGDIARNLSSGEPRGRSRGAR